MTKPTLNVTDSLASRMWLFYMLNHNDSILDFVTFLKEYFKNDNVIDVSLVNSTTKIDFIFIFDSDETKTLFILKHL